MRISTREPEMLAMLQQRFFFLVVLRFVFTFISDHTRVVKYGGQRLFDLFYLLLFPELKIRDFAR